MARLRRQYHPTPQRDLLALPLDIQHEIFLWLSSVNQDVLNYGLTCKDIFYVFDKVLFVQYRRSLNKQGLRDNPHCERPLKDRWALLLARTCTWLELDPQPFEFDPLDGLLDVTNVGLCPVAFIANFTRPPSESDNSRPLVRWIQFPYQIVDDSGELTFEGGGYNFPLGLKLSMQNLKLIGSGSAVSEHNSYIYVLRGDNPAFPGVSTVAIGRSDLSEENAGRMNLPLPLDAIISRVVVEAAGENLAIILQYSNGNSSREEGGFVNTDLLVLDWNTLVPKLETSSRRQSCDPALVFLSEELLLHPSSWSCALNIYSMLPSAMLGLAAPSNQPICCLELPPLGEGNYISSIDGKCSPNPTAQDVFPKNVPVSMAFTEDPKEAIAVFTITIRCADDSKEWKFLMVVHRKALLDVVLQNLPSNTSSSSPSGVIPWDEWGPSNVRWLPAFDGALSQSWGQRIFELDNDALHVLNFNPKEIQSLLRSRDTPTVHKLVSNVFPHQGAFKDELVGKLPCIRQQVPLEPFEADSAWFDGARFVFSEGASNATEGEECKSTLKALYFG